MKNKLYVFYGLPASGKQTIAELLSKELGIELYYHHLAFDDAFKKHIKHSKEFKKYYKNLFFGTLENITKNKSLITTFNYHSGSKEKITLIREIAIKNNLDIIFIKLETSFKNMCKRVVLEKRKKNKKMLTVEELTEYINLRPPSEIDILPKEKRYIYNTDNVSENEVLFNIMKDILEI